MTIKNQLVKIRDNWLFVLIAVVLFGVFVFKPANIGLYGISSFGAGSKMAMDDGFYGERVSASSLGYPSSYRIGYPSPITDFAPDAPERKVTKTASISNEIERGKFRDAEKRLNDIVSSTNSLVLDENVNNYGSKRRSQFRGSYSLKVEAEKYDIVIEHLKEIGEVTSFSGNAQDETGGYVNLALDLEAEKSRLARYREMYNEAAKIEDKINLNDRIFDQERKVKYLEDSLKNIDQRVAYSTISVSLQEKQSDYINVVLVKFSELARVLAGSFNSLLILLFAVFPYAVFIGIVYAVYRFVKRRS